MIGRIARVVPGGPAEAALVAEIRRLQSADRLAPVWVVVGGPVVGLSLRRRLAADGAFAAVRFTPLGVLVQQLGGRAGALGGRLPLSEAGLRAAARVALASAPGVLEPVASHPATEASVAATYRDLRRASAAELDRLAAASARAADVVALVRVMRRILEAHYYDPSDLLEAAIASLAAAGSAAAGSAAAGSAAAGSAESGSAESGSAAAGSAAAGSAETGSAESGSEGLTEIGGLVVYLPDPMRPDEAALLAALSRHIDVLVLAGQTGDELADRAVDRSVEALAQRFAGVAGVASAGAAGPASGVAGPASAGVAVKGRAPGDNRVTWRFDTLLSAPDDDVEVREAVRCLVGHAESGGDLGRCVVTFPDGARSAEIARRVAEQLKAAGIPCSGGAALRLGETPHAQLLAGLVELAMPVPSGRELDRGQVMGWLGRGPIRSDRGITRQLPTVQSGGSLPVGTWDRSSRTAGVLSGIVQWRSRLRAQMARSEERNREGDGHGAGATADLLEFIERLHALTSAAASPLTWAGLHAWADDALEELLEPGDERTSLADALGDLDLLDAVDPLDQLPPSERLRRFALALEVVFGRPAGERGRFGVGPTVGSLRTVAGLSSEIVLVLGCREGDLPARQLVDPLVPPAERAHVEALAQRERVDEVARRHLVWALAGADRSQASFARIDVRAGRAVYPSCWTAELFSGRPTEVASFAGSIRQVTEGAAAADSTDFELASLPDAAARRSPNWLELLDTDFRRRRKAVLDRREGGLSPFAGYVPATGSATDAWSDAMSATGLERFAACPFRFFVERKLGVRKLEEPERLVAIDARDRGTLMHEVLEGFFGTVEDGPITVLDGAALDRLRALAAAQFERFELLGKTGKELFWHTERARIGRDLERYVARDIADSVATGRVPVRVELRFGDDDAPVVVQVAGRDVMFHGRIDRVDLTGDDRLVVVDYKSGKSASYQDIVKDPLSRGRQLQLPIYAKAAVEVLGPSVGSGGPARAEYRFVQAVAGYAVVPVELTDELNDQLHEVLGTLVATIDAGCFPPHPGAPAQGSQYENCRYCDFDALCTTDRAELWERASDDHRMKAYADLVAGTSS